jgi:hypothetical protein
MLDIKDIWSNLKKENLFPEYNYSLNLPKNLKEKDRSIFFDIQKRKAKQVDLHLFKDVFLVFDTIIINFFIWDELTHAIRLKILAKLKRLYFFLTRKTVKIEKGVWIIDNWSNNFYHWNSEALPRLVTCLPYLDNHPVLLPEEFIGIKYVEESLKLLGLDIFFFDKRINLVISDLISVSKAGYVIDFQKNSLFKLRDLMWEHAENSAVWRRIYISREYANHRKVLNENDVIELLRIYNFEVVYFELLSVKDQIMLMKQTKVLVGLHGAGMVNMLYMPPKGNVLEFRNKDDSWVLSQSFYSLASILEHDYFYTDNSATSDKTGFADFNIDVGKLEEALIQLLG